MFFNCILLLVALVVPMPIQDLGFGIVDFPANFLSAHRAVSMNTAALLSKKTIGIFLPNSQALNRHGYTWQEEVKQIDKQIAELQDLQDKYRASMRRNTNNAMRWQFQRENYGDARRAWDRAAEEKQKIREIQDQIDDLSRRKKQLKKENAS